MAVTEVKSNISIDTSKVEFICPVCKSKKLLDIPKSVIAEAKQLTTMSIAKGLVCDHQFQAFVDKNCAVRGYQRVDFEFENAATRKNKPNPEKFKNSDKELFKNLILEGNYLEYRPKRTISDKNSQNNNYRVNSQTKEENQNKHNNTKSNKMTLQDIYNEFWEFIDENNEVFREFIIKDPRRKEKKYISEIL